MDQWVSCMGLDFEIYVELSIIEDIRKDDFICYVSTVSTWWP